MLIPLSMLEQKYLLCENDNVEIVVMLGRYHLEIDLVDFHAQQLRYIEMYRVPHF